MDELHRQFLIKLQIERLVDSMSWKEGQVLTLYFGLGGVPQLTMLEIGEAMGLSRERIRQIKEKAIRRARIKIIFERKAKCQKYDQQ